MRARLLGMMACWLVLVGSLAGCPRTPQEEPPKTELTEAERIVVANYMLNFSRTARVFAALQPLARELGGSFTGVCPTVTTTPADGTQTTIDLNFDGDGCAPSTTTWDVSGRATYRYGGESQVGELRFAEFTIEDAPITGTADLGFNTTDNSVEFTGSFSFTIGAISPAGIVTVRYDNDSLRFISGFWSTDFGADLELLDTANPFQQPLVVPIDDNPDALPAAGVIAFRIDGALQRVTIACSPETPTTRAVAVTVGDDGPFPMTLPAFPAAEAQPTAGAPADDASS